MQPLPLRTSFRRLPLELLFWVAALVALAATNPHEPGLIELCVFKWFGLPRCPGCGLGHAIAHLFHGEWALSFQAHPLGGLALVLLIGRILTLTRQTFQPISRRSVHSTP